MTFAIGYAGCAMMLVGTLTASDAIYAFGLPLGLYGAVMIWKV